MYLQMQKFAFAKDLFIFNGILYFRIFKVIIRENGTQTFIL